MDLKSNIGFQTMSLNDNLNFLGKVLHIQTEKILCTSPCIQTHVFSRGRVVHTTKYEFPADTELFDDFGKIQELMHAQHRKVMEKIIRQRSKYGHRT